MEHHDREVTAPLNDDEIEAGLKEAPPVPTHYVETDRTEGGRDRTLMHVGGARLEWRGKSPEDIDDETEESVHASLHFWNRREIEGSDVGAFSRTVFWGSDADDAHIGIDQYVIDDAIQRRSTRTIMLSPEQAIALSAELLRAVEEAMDMREAKGRPAFTVTDRAGMKPSEAKS